VAFNTTTLAHCDAVREGGNHSIYLGFDVLKPEVAHGVHGYHRGLRKAELAARLAKMLADQPSLIAGLSRRDNIPFNADTDFDDSGRLTTDAPSVTPFIRP
jgi:NAD(P)H dehydrogenase (quinone)